MLGLNSPQQAKLGPGKVLLVLVALIGVFAVWNVLGDKKPSLLSVFEAEEREFQDFLERFKKEYKGDEYFQRARKFRDNLVYIRRFNSMQQTAVLGINKFADMSFAEFSSIYLRPEQPIKPTFNFPSYEVDPLPITVDWVAKNQVTPVKDQGHCGSCYSFAATGAIESAWAIFYNLTSNLPTFSEQQIMDCSTRYGNQGCGGGYAWTSFEYVKNNTGINSEAGYPYTAKNGECNATLASHHIGNISDYKNVTAFNYIALKQAVVQQPVATSVEANLQWHLYTSGIITQDCGYALNHAVLITGYNTTSLPYWTVKNSWGTDWGMSGYVHIGMLPGPGVCGINTRPVYPII